jgi:hypothetical protein
MAQNDIFKKYLDAGLAFTALTQARAEALVKDLVKAGEVQADQAREAAPHELGVEPTPRRRGGSPSVRKRTSWRSAWRAPS